MIDASIYQNSNRPSVQLDNPLDVAGKAMTLKQLGMQNEAAQKKLSDEQRSKMTRDAIPEFKQLMSLPPEEQAKAYGPAMKRLADKGMPTDNLIKDQNGNFVYDPQLLKMQLTGISNTPEWLANEKALGEVNKLGYDNKKSELDSQRALASMDPNSERSQRARESNKMLLGNVGLGNIINPNMSEDEINSLAKEGLAGKAVSGVYGLQGRQITSDRVANSYNHKVNTQDINSANNKFKDQVLNKEAVKLNAASGVQSLISAIENGDIKDSKNVSRQLTNMIATIEMGNPGGQGDREAMGVNTLYGDLKGALGYIESNPTSVIPNSYLSQLKNESYALGDRAARNYKTYTDSLKSGADQSAFTDDGSPGNVHILISQRASSFLKSNGYDPETGERIKKDTQKKSTVNSSASPVVPDGYIAMKFPDGSVKQVKSDDKGKWIDAGGSVVK